MAKKLAGYKAKLYIGTAGTTAPTQVTRARDLECDIPIDYDETTDRGDSSTIPKKDREPVAIDAKITWSMTVKESDSVMTTILAAATNPTPTPLAVKYVNSLGNTLFDGDCYVKAKDGSPLGGRATYDFEAIPTTAGGRDWLINGS